MVTAAIGLGHTYLVLTDHSPRLTVARGLSPERLREQIDVVADRKHEYYGHFWARRRPEDLR
jgi:putative hydrolase